MMRMGCISLC